MVKLVSRRAPPSACCRVHQTSQALRTVTERGKGPLNVSSGYLKRYPRHTVTLDQNVSLSNSVVLVDMSGKKNQREKKKTWSLRWATSTLSGPIVLGTSKNDNQFLLGNCHPGYTDHRINILSTASSSPITAD